MPGWDGVRDWGARRGAARIGRMDFERRTARVQGEGTAAGCRFLLPGRLPVSGNESERDLLRLTILSSGNSMRSWWRNAARRRVFSGSGVASLLLAAAAMSGSWARGQVEVPRYRSPVEAPTPQQLPPLPAPAAVSPGATVVEYPIARVNDQIIDNSDYQREREELVQQAQQKKLSAADLEQLEKDQLRDMIDWQLLLSRGKELEINADAEVIRQLDEIRKEHNLDSMDALDKAVRDSGMSVEDFKQKIKEDVITQEVIQIGRAHV